MHGFHRGGWGGGPGAHAGDFPGYDHDRGDGFGPGNDGGQAWTRFGGDTVAGGRGGFILGAIVRHVRATATQESVMRAAFDEFRSEMKDVGGGEAKKTRQDLSAAMRKPHFDEVFMGELFARQDTAIERTRKAFVGLMARIHEVLDEEQRGRLAELMEKGPRFWRRGFDW
jgi:Spy/CpxP family protein refolding chaperone